MLPSKSLDWGILIELKTFFLFTVLFKRPNRPSRHNSNGLISGDLSNVIVQY